MIGARVRLSAALGLGLALSPGASRAMYVLPDLVRVPVDRLVENLRRQVDAAPRDTRRRLALARVQAMAYAEKAVDFPVRSPVRVTARIIPAAGLTPRAMTFVAATAEWAGEQQGWHNLIEQSGPETDSGCARTRLVGVEPFSGALRIEADLTAGPAPLLPYHALGLSVGTANPGEPAIAECVLLRLRRQAQDLGFRVPSVGPLDLEALGAHEHFLVGFDFEAGHEAGPYFGPEPRYRLPVLPARDAAAKAVAQEHLKGAIANYEAILRETPGDPVAALGLGFCEAQRGRIGPAIAAYRAAVAGGTTASDSLSEDALSEAVEALTTLLDPVVDAAELRRLESMSIQLRARSRPITPILLPLSDDTRLADLVDPSAAVPFDLDGSGVRRRWGWLRPDAAWLVYDHDDSGRIDSGLQLLGAVSFGAFWPTGYDALRALDDDDDGALRGAELVHLALWRDADADGVSAPREVRPLSDWGVVALDTHFTLGAEGAPFSPRGAELADGRTRPTWDWSAPLRSTP